MHILQKCTVYCWRDTSTCIKIDFTSILAPCCASIGLVRGPHQTRLSFGNSTQTILYYHSLMFSPGGKGLWVGVSAGFAAR